MKKEHVEQWIGEHAPGETLVAYTPATSQQPISFAVQNSGGRARVIKGRDGGAAAERTELVEVLGYTQDDRAGRGTAGVFYALTDQHFFLGSQSSFRSRPKELIHAAPRDEVTMHWFESDDGANHFRNFVIEFGDGTYRSDRIITRALGRQAKTDALSAALVDALGQHAIEY